MHGVGVGKTRTVLEFINQKNPCNVLIVGTQKGVIVWESEIEKHQFHIPVLTAVEGTVKDRASKILKFTRESVTQFTKIAVINYEAFSRKFMLENLARVKWDMIIFDEVHRLRNHTTKQSRNAFTLAKLNPNAVRIGLTGTIIYNKPLDVFGVFRFIDPKVFGTNWFNFKFRYAVWGGQFGQIPLYPINTEELKAKVQANSHIVDRHKVLDLPDEQHIERRSAFSATEARAYKVFDKEFVVYLEDRTKLVALNVLDKILKLQQLTGGFMYDKDLTIQFSSAKIDLLESVLEEIGDDNSVIFYKFKEEARLIADLCTRLNLPYYYVNGQNNQYAEWKHQSTPSVLVVQIQSGSESLDFTKAAATVFYSLIYSYGQYEQALGRTSRANQERRSVAYYYLIIKDSIDEKIWKALQNKKDLITEILNVVL